MVEWNSRRFVAETSNKSSYLILAANRTHRRDPSDGFKYYNGGWDIANPHYLYSVAFSAAPPVIIAGIWQEHYGYSRTAYAFSLIFLIAFTIVAIAGIGFLYTGQEKFQNSIVDTLSYLLHEADTIIVNLKNLFDNLLSAKNVAVGQSSLTAEYQNSIDDIGKTINIVSDEFRNVTGKNSNEIRSFLDPMRCTLIYVAVAMLILASLGFCKLPFAVHSRTAVSCLLLSDHWMDSCGGNVHHEWHVSPCTQEALHQLFPSCDTKHDKENMKRIVMSSEEDEEKVLSLVEASEKYFSEDVELYYEKENVFLTIVFLAFLCVIVDYVLMLLRFCPLHSSVVADSCIAMDEWLLNPAADSALGNILPKVDNETAQEISSVTKGTTFGIINVLNGAINNVSNANIPPELGPLYYNQSGPLMPVLCNPYNKDLTDRQCATGEVDFANASKVWRHYICQASAAGICTTPGRLTLDRYSQMTASVNVSYGLYCTSPFLLNLTDSTFLKQTFADISKDYCPSLRQYTRWMYIGFITSSISVMFLLVLWIVYARERRHRIYTKRVMTRPPGIHFDRDKAP
ncbi:unnamed protein product [Ilex paraguariensis]|uniref:Uncharacterized protein n=1 Tax=Ilex paraguariensis TaxID=185542 RepID=A0ABC8SPC7_9AQUA